MPAVDLLPPRHRSRSLLPPRPSPPLRFAATPQTGLPSSGSLCSIHATRTSWWPREKL